MFFWELPFGIPKTPHLIMLRNLWVFTRKILLMRFLRCEKLYYIFPPHTPFADDEIENSKKKWKCGSWGKDVEGTKKKYVNLLPLFLKDLLFRLDTHFCTFLSWGGFSPKRVCVFVYFPFHSSLSVARTTIEMECFLKTKRDDIWA